MFTLAALSLLLAAPPMAVPAGWSVSEVDAVWVFSPPGIAADDFVRLEVYPAEAGNASTWSRANWAVFKKPFTDVEENFSEQHPEGMRSVATASGLMSDPAGGKIGAVLWTISDGKMVQPVLYVCGSQESYSQYGGIAASSIASLEFPGAAATKTFAKRRHLYRQGKVGVAAAPPSAPTDASKLAGSWESGRTVGAMTTTSTLDVGLDGSYHWVTVSGGVVGGRAFANRSRDERGTLSLSGRSATFRAEDGTVKTSTLNIIAGSPPTAFTIENDTFTRRR